MPPMNDYMKDQPKRGKSEAIRQALQDLAGLGFNLAGINPKHVSLKRARTLIEEYKRLRTQHLPPDLAREELL